MTWTAKVFAFAVLATICAGPAAATTVPVCSIADTYLPNTEYPGKDADPFIPKNGACLGGSPALVKVTPGNPNAEVNGQIGDDTGIDYTSLFSVIFDTGTSGSWAFTSAPGALIPTKLLISSAGSFFWIPILDPTGGTFVQNLIKNKNGIDQGISHIEFFDTASPVPLPAAAWLLLSAIGALGLIKKFRGTQT